MHAGFEVVVFSFWLIPLALLCSTLYGYIQAKFRFKSTDSTSKLIIQITTIENYNLVNKIISTIRSYNLNLPYEIWIVTEFSLIDKYKDADRVLDLPTDFKSVARYKARALDYSSQVRKNEGITDSHIKVLFLDDDTIASKEYIEKCFVGDYDIMQGIIQPKLNYGNRYSYIDNIRTLSCISLCSVFQGNGHPLWVHGEGICVKASIEQEVGWRFDIIASEDLAFGHTCATKKLRWGFIWESVYITSPWNFKDFFKQRKRWLWGNVDVISRILTWKSSLRLLIFYGVGGAAIIISIIGVIMDVLSMLHFSTIERVELYVAFGVWLGLYGYVGNLVGDKKLKHILLSMVLAWYTSFMNTLPIWLGLLFSRPKKFEVIAKERIPNTSKEPIDSRDSSSPGSK
jgi:cellulose synthase/poly-beta-1,6-N-acetylglucosamine synthase-like glycosyltransferase